MTKLLVNTHNADLQKVELARIIMSLMQLAGFDSCHESTGGQVLDNDRNQ
jgi:hypothetical protein